MYHLGDKSILDDAEPLDDATKNCPKYAFPTASHNPMGLLMWFLLMCFRNPFKV